MTAKQEVFIKFPLFILVCLYEYNEYQLNLLDLTMNLPQNITYKSYKENDLI